MRSSFVFGLCKQSHLQSAEGRQKQLQEGESISSLPCGLWRFVLGATGEEKLCGSVRGWLGEVNTRHLAGRSCRAVRLGVSFNLD